MVNKKTLFLMVASFCITVSVSAKPLFIGKIDQKPLEVAIAFLQNQLPSGDSEGKEEVTLQQKRIFCKGQDACPLQAQVTFIIDGLNDDSIQKERHILILQQNSNQVWEITQDQVSRICRNGRGHLQFSEAVCK